MKKPKIKIEKNKDLIKKDLIITLDKENLNQIGRIFIHIVNDDNTESETHFIQL